MFIALKKRREEVVEKNTNCKLEQKSNEGKLNLPFALKMQGKFQKQYLVIESFKKRKILSIGSKMIKTNVLLLRLLT